MNTFICVCIDEKSKYCDQQFFASLAAASRNRHDFINIVDYSKDRAYYYRLKILLKDWLGGIDYHISRIETFDLIDAMNAARRAYLFCVSTAAKCFINIEPGILIPENTFECFDSIPNDVLICGAVYDMGSQNLLLFDPAVDELFPTNYVLNGCFLARYELLKKCPFRIDYAYLHNPPSFTLCDDARIFVEGKIIEHTKIKCQKIEVTNYAD